jgi:hypothetical protein
MFLMGDRAGAGRRRGCPPGMRHRRETVHTDKRGIWVHYWFEGLQLLAATLRKAPLRETDQDHGENEW